MRDAPLRWVVLPLVFICLVPTPGCQSAQSRSDAPTASAGSTASSAAEVDSRTPTERLAEQLRSSTFQLDTALSSIEQALALAHPLSKTGDSVQKEGLQVVVDLIESAGATLSELPTEAPAVELVGQATPKYEAVRQKNLEECLDAHHELLDAQGQLDGIVEDDKDPKSVASLEEVGAALDDAIDAVEGAIQALGGTVPEDPTSEEASSPAIPKPGNS